MLTILITRKWNDVLIGVGFESGNFCIQTGQIKTLRLQNLFLCVVQVKNVEYFVDSINRSRLPVSAASDGSEWPIVKTLCDSEFKPHTLFLFCQRRQQTEWLPYYDDLKPDIRISLVQTSARNCNLYV